MDSGSWFKKAVKEEKSGTVYLKQIIFISVPSRVTTPGPFGSLSFWARVGNDAKARGN